MKVTIELPEELLEIARTEMTAAGFAIADEERFANWVAQAIFDQFGWHPNFEWLHRPNDVSLLFADDDFQLDIRNSLKSKGLRDIEEGSCVHQMVMDDEHPSARCCQKCGHVEQSLQFAAVINEI